MRAKCGPQTPRAPRMAPTLVGCVYWVVTSLSALQGDRRSNRRVLTAWRGDIQNGLLNFPGCHHMPLRGDWDLGGKSDMAH